MTRSAQNPRGSTEPGAAESPDQVDQLVALRPGDLESLAFRPAPRRAPDPGYVEIAVEAAGLNFKDVLFALGLIPVPSGVKLPLGVECAGTVAAVGDGVDGVAVGDAVVGFGFGCFASRALAPAALARPVPRGLAAVEAATLPVAFTTAYHALVELGRLQAGERVLIHTATGGVGLAALQIAEWVGAEIHATAGSEEKRRLLRSLGVERVMDSRSRDFATEVMKATGGRGVHVVLNSLSGELLHASLSVVAPHGRFLEIGKRDIYADTPVGLRQFERGLSFHAVNLDWRWRDFPPLWHRVLELVADGTLDPLPHRVFPYSEARRAFRHMARARHVGKVVLTPEAA